MRGSSVDKPLLKLLPNLKHNSEQPSDHSNVSLYLQSLRISVPRPVAMLITTLQLSQMIVGMVVNLYAFYVKSHGVHCLVESRHINLALIMYISYFVLFGNFFYNAYFSKKRAAAAAAAARKAKGLGIGDVSVKKVD